MMGWAQRAREHRERTCEVHQYRVRRWTAFDWSYPEGEGKAVREARSKMRKDHTDHLKRTAGKMARKLQQLRGDWSPVVKDVRVGGEPQLLFELVVPGLDERDARVRFARAVERALSVKVSPDRNPPARGSRRVTTAVARKMYPAQERTLRPPWGKTEVELV